MSAPGRGRAEPLWRALGLTLAASLLLPAWDALSTWLIVLHARFLLDDELRLYLVVKAGFVVILAVVVTLCRGWRALGYRGGTGWRLWALMLPAWLSAALSLVQGAGDIVPARCLGWLALGVLIALGEETIFRGVVMHVLAGRGPRQAILASSVLFGLVHLVGIGAGVDIRMVAAQVVYATGLGISFAWVRTASGSIWPCVIAHAVMDGIGLAAADGVANALRYEADSYPAALASAAASLAWGIFLLSRQPSAISFGAAAARPAGPVIPGEDRAG